MAVASGGGAGAGGFVEGRDVDLQVQDDHNYSVYNIHSI